MKSDVILRTKANCSRLMSSSFFSLCLSVFVLFVGQGALATGAGITYHGRMLNPQGQPVETAGVQFKIQIRSPNVGNCLLYEETKVVDMRNSNGGFSLTINDGVGSVLPGSFQLDDVFSNRKSFSITHPNLSCASSTVYNPSPTDGRKLVVQFKEAAAATWETLSPMDINFVPVAFEAAKVGGFGPDDLLRVNRTDPANETVNQFTFADYTNLVDLIAGTSTLYQRAGSLNGATITTPSTAGDVLSWNGTAWVGVTPSTNLSGTAVTGTLPVSKGGTGRTSFSNHALLLTDASGAPTAGLTCSTTGHVPSWNGSTWACAAASSGAGDFKADGTVAMTGAIRLPAGALATPSLTFTGDLDAGIYHPAADIIAIVTDGAERIRVTDSGRIGFNTDDPQSSYDFEGAGDVSFNVGGNVCVGCLTSPGSRLHVAGDMTADRVIGGSGGLVANFATDSVKPMTFSLDTNEKMRIDTDGDLGIGTNSPSQRLEVSGGGIKVSPGAAVKPTCSSTTRGTFWFTEGATGVKDNVEVCAKDAANAYAWRTIY